jgi:PAS domain S-box-containing protein
MSSEEAYWWRERYRVLFERNVAGIILTNTEGRILDCNEPCARIFGLNSRDEMLTHSAWDFYFHRGERENLVSRLRTRGHCPAEKVCLRRKNGEPVWVLTSRTVASFADGLPELLQGTASGSAWQPPPDRHNQYTQERARPARLFALKPCKIRDLTTQNARP